MTSRTIDVSCATCRKYMFSLHPRATSEELTKSHYCSVKCENQQTIPKNTSESIWNNNEWIDFI